MKEQFIPKELYLRIIPKGYNRPSINNYGLPLWQEVIDWLRTEHHLMIKIDIEEDDNFGKRSFNYQVKDIDHGGDRICITLVYGYKRQSYYDALEEAIKFSITQLKDCSIKLEQVDHYYELYQTTLKSGMFWEFFPTLSGIWKDDQVEFITTCEKFKRENPLLK